MTKKDLREYHEKLLIEGKCDSKEDRMLSLAIVEAVTGTLTINSESGKEMIHLLDAVNDLMQQLGYVPQGQTFYGMLGD